MAYTYKNGLREGVIFAFYKNGEILIEHRPSNNGNQDTFFLNGSIEDIDYKGNEDYKVTAMRREVLEELQGKVEVTSFEYLGELAVEGIGVIFYIFIVMAWNGSIPEFTVENNQKFSDVEWIKLSDREKYFQYDSAFVVCEMIENYTASNS